MHSSPRRAAILIGAPRAESPVLPFDKRIPGHLLSLADKPWLQHVVEALRDAGVTHVHCFDAIAPERGRALLDDGRRWGCSVTHHAVSDPDCPFGALQHVDLGTDTCWVAEVSDWAAPGVGERVAPCRLVTTTGEAVGWALLDHATRQRVPPSLAARDLAAWLALQISNVIACPVLRLRDGAGIVDMQRAVLEGRHPAHIEAARVEPGVWVGRNVRMHPSVVTHAPLLLAADSWLQANCCVGPNVVVGAGAIVGSQCVVADAYLDRGTVLGDGLELRRAFAWSSRIWNVDHATELGVRDDHILSSLTADSSARSFSTLMARAVAAALLIAASPLLACIAAARRMRRGYVSTTARVALLPAQDYPHQRDECELALWDLSPARLPRLRHLACWLLPGLWHVARGKLRWVGIAPRGWEELDAVTEDVRLVLIQARCGLVDEAWVRYGPSAVDGSDAETRTWADVYQTVHREAGYSRRLLIDYLRCLLTGRHAAASHGCMDVPGQGDRR